MIVYRVENASGVGPFMGTSSFADRADYALWTHGPTPREDGLRGPMGGRVCGVADPALLPRWFLHPHSLRAWGYHLTVWDAPDGAWLKHQALFDRDASTLLRTMDLPDAWDDDTMALLTRLWDV